jgi:hypothetical protein
MAQRAGAGYRERVTSPHTHGSRHAEAAADLGRAPGHEVTVIDGRFVRAECSCGWRGAGRRHRATAREEARDHALLYADGSELAAGPAPAPAPAPAAVPAPASTPERADA